MRILMALIFFTTILKVVYPQCNTICNFIEAPTFNSGSSPCSNFELTQGSVIPPQDQMAIDFVFSLWENFCTSNETIRVQITYMPLGLNELAYTEIPSYPNTQSDTNHVYPVALAQAIDGMYHWPSYDMIIYINNNPQIPWNRTPLYACDTLNYDLATLLIHEIAHGLGLYSTFRKGPFQNFIVGRENITGTTVPAIFDEYIFDSTFNYELKEYLNIPPPTLSLQDFGESNDIYWNGFLDSDGNSLKIYAPSTFKAGKTLRHIDENSIPDTDTAQILTPYFCKGEAIYSLGLELIGILDTLGWEICPSYWDILASQEQPSSEHIVFPTPSRERTCVKLPYGVEKVKKVFLIDSSGNSFEGKLDFSGINNQILQILHPGFSPGVMFIRLILEGGDEMVFKQLIIQ